jgi:signal transduction histidine kinase
MAMTGTAIEDGRAAVLRVLDAALAAAVRTEQVARTAGETLATACRFDAAGVFLADEAGAAVRLLMVHDPHDLLPGIATNAPRVARGTGLTWRAIAERRTIVAPVDAPPEDPSGLRDRLRAAGVRTLAVVPLVTGPQVFGALALVSRRPPEAYVAVAETLDAAAASVVLALRRAADTGRMMDAARRAAVFELAAGVSHETRNLLAAYETRLRLLRAALGPGVGGDIAHHLDALDDTAVWLRRIVDALGRYGATGPRPREPVVVADLLFACRDVLAEEALRHAVRIVVHAPPALPSVAADPTELLRAVVNLATDGLEAMAESGGQLTLSAVPAGGGVRIDVTDTGSGDAPPRPPSIARPFFSSKPQSAGLGLASVRGLVEHELGGSLTVRREAGTGTICSVMLPPSAAVAA